MKSKIVCLFPFPLFPLPFLLTIFLLLFSGCERKAAPVSTAVVENQIRAILELPLYEQYYRDIVYFGEEARFLGIRHIDRRVLFSIELRLQTGIDLTKGVQIIPIGDDRLRILLPDPEILLVDADESTIEQFFLKEFGKTIKRLDYYEEIERGKERIREEALQEGVLDKSRSRAREAIRALFSELAPGGVIVQFRKSSGTTIPGSSEDGEQ
jgi:hypothetical protein